MALASQAFQNIFPHLLRFAEEFLILEKQAVKFQRFVGGKIFAQNHVAHMYGVGKCRFFRQFFQRRVGIIVVHADILIRCDGFFAPSF